MEEGLAYAVWFLVELVLIRTGRVAIWAGSAGQWRGEDIASQEGRIYGAAGALSFVRNGRRVVTDTGMIFAGILFYVVLVVGLLLIFL